MAPSEGEAGPNDAEDNEKTQEEPLGRRGQPPVGDRQGHEEVRERPREILRDWSERLRTSCRDTCWTVLRHPRASLVHFWAASARRRADHLGGPALRV